VNILWIKVGGLWPPDAGGRLRSLHLLSELSRRHRLTLLTTHGPEDDPRALASRLDRVEVVSVPWGIPKKESPAFALALARSWLTRHPVDLLKFRVPALRDALRRRADEGVDDLWIADFLSATASLPGGASPPVLHFAHNVEHVIWRRLATVERRPLRRLLLEIEWRKMRRAEARTCARAALTVAVSDGDAALLAATAQGARTASIPTGVDTAYFTPALPSRERQEIVFTGSMDWHPNEDAMLHFIDETWPRIRSAAPGTSCTVAGRSPSPRLRARATAAGVRVTGTVPDIRPYLAEAAVCIVPLRVGGGTRLKIFEALAMGKAVVSTTVGAEGLPLVDGVHYLRADAPDEFARVVVSLLDDPQRRAALGGAGRTLVESRYGWERVAEEFEVRCGEALRAEEGRQRPASSRFLRRIAPAALVRQARALRDLGSARRHYGAIQVRRALGLVEPVRPVTRAARVVLYVCRGNIIRSPMAGALLRQALLRQAPAGEVNGEANGEVHGEVHGEVNGGATVLSAGLYARRGQPADARAVRAARSFGVSLDGHHARPLTGRMVAEADLIVPMDAFIEAVLIGRYPEARERIRPFAMAVAGRRPRVVEIRDPYDGDIEDVRRCFELLRACVLRQAESLLERPDFGAASARTREEGRPCA
jgi:protein-tyrosine-phosphatase/glycosyltransferase involved in cell wall biosynthesis